MKNCIFIAAISVLCIASNSYADPDSRRGDREENESYAVCIAKGNSAITCSQYSDKGSDNGSGYVACLNAGNSPITCSQYPSKSPDAEPDYNRRYREENESYAVCIEKGNSAITCSQYSDKGSDNGRGYTACLDAGNSPITCSQYPSLAPSSPADGRPRRDQGHRADSDSEQQSSDKKAVDRREDSSEKLNAGSQQLTEDVYYSSGPSSSNQTYRGNSATEKGEKYSFSYKEGGSYYIEYFAENYCIPEADGSCRYKNPTIILNGELHVLSAGLRSEETMSVFCQRKGQVFKGKHRDLWIGCNGNNMCDLPSAEVNKSGNLVRADGRWGMILEGICHKSKR